MSIADNYRNMAEIQRRNAAAAILPLVRQQFLSAAERWDWLATQAEATQAGIAAMFENSPRTAH